MTAHNHGPCPGCEARRRRPDPSVDGTARHPWHVAINRYHEDLRTAGDGERRSWMYEAKSLADEVPRLVILFEKERLGLLDKHYKQCSRAEVVPVEDNRLTCCLGVECRSCPALLALEKAETTPEMIDRAKAWTCAAHILSEGGDVAGEGYLLTVDDRMFWDRTYASMAGSCPDPGEII